MTDGISHDTLKALIEAILYVSPEPVTLDMLADALPGEARDRIKGILYGLMNDYAWPQHGIQIRPVAGGWKFSSKPEHHETLRAFVKSLKAPVRLTKPSLEVLAMIAYRQPITVPEINEIRGVDCGGVIHTLMERKLITTAGRKNVVGRPILYRTSREFMLAFGLRDLSELPSLREFEEMARQALGSELLPRDALLPDIEATGKSAGERDGEPASIAATETSSAPIVESSPFSDGADRGCGSGAPEGITTEDINERFQGCAPAAASVETVKTTATPGIETEDTEPGEPGASAGRT